MSSFFGAKIGNRTPIIRLEI